MKTLPQNAATKALGRGPARDLVSYEGFLKRISEQVDLAEGSAWMIADLLVQAEETLGEEAYQLFEDVSNSKGLSIRTIKNYLWLGRKFPPKDRTVAASMGVYDSCSGIEDPKTRHAMLVYCASNKLTVPQARDAVAKAVNKPAKEEPEKFQCPCCSNWTIHKTWTLRDAEELRDNYIIDAEVVA
jgi:hypothetical protein